MTKFIVTDALSKPLAVNFETQADADDYAIRAAVARGRATNVWEVAALDVAAVARIAEADCPRLTVQGGGLLGAGTHPAQPYLEAMRAFRGVTRDNIRTVGFGYDKADQIVLRFLDNASTWRGETARTLKAHLRGMLA